VWAEATVTSLERIDAAVINYDLIHDLLVLSS
jgi:hypothetical protein